MQRVYAARVLYAYPRRARAESELRLEKNDRERTRPPVPQIAYTKKERTIEPEGRRFRVRAGRETRLSDEGLPLFRSPGKRYAASAVSGRTGREYVNMEAKLRSLDDNLL